MILAQFWRNESQQVVALEITGHADAGPYGQDIVCAAVSAVTIGTINSLQQIAHVQVQLQDGQWQAQVLRIEAKNND